MGPDALLTILISYGHLVPLRHWPPTTGDFHTFSCTWRGPGCHGGPGGSIGAVKSTGPQIVSILVVLTAERMASLSSTLVERLSTSTAHSKTRKCMRGCVHCRFVLFSNSGANSPLVS